MQIQTIAQHCGMTDANYFTLAFHRLTSKTSTQYRQSIASRIPLRHSPPRIRRIHR